MDLCGDTGTGPTTGAGTAGDGSAAGTTVMDCRGACEMATHMGVPCEDGCLQFAFNHAPAYPGGDPSAWTDAQKAEAVAQSTMAMNPSYPVCIPDDGSGGANCAFPEHLTGMAEIFQGGYGAIYCPVGGYKCEDVMA